jgi:type IV secretory pathway protease TraF
MVTAAIIAPAAACDWLLSTSFTVDTYKVENLSSPVLKKSHVIFLCILCPPKIP